MYTLYTYPNSYAMTVHCLMEELNLAYECRWVGIFTDKPDPEFQKVSPHARVPALVTPDGPIFETGAIALYLAERHGNGGYQIPVGDNERGRFLQWFYYLGTTLQPDVMVQFHPEVYFADDKTQERYKAASRLRLAKILTTLSDAIGDGPFFFGERITILDFLLALQAIWPEIYPGEMNDFPVIKRHVDRMLARPAVAKIYELHMSKRNAPIKGPSPDVAAD